MSKTPTPLESIIHDIDLWINKTEDEEAKYPLMAVKEMILNRMDDESKFAGKMYDYGASARYPYETGLKFYKEFLKKNK